MPVPHNLFAWTAPGGDPEYVSLNIVDGEFELTVRSRPEHGGHTAMVRLDDDQASALALALITE